MLQEEKRKKVACYLAGTEIQMAKALLRLLWMLTEANRNFYRRKFTQLKMPNSISKESVAR
jgi:hypothetical protein